MGLLKTQQEIFVVFLGKVFKETKVISPELIQPLWQGYHSVLGKHQDGGFCTQRLDWDQHPIGVEDLVLGLKECENSHTLTTTTTVS